MANVIDDQERFREIQTRILQQFDRSVVDPSVPLDDEEIVERTHDFILEQIKRDIARKLSAYETFIRFTIMVNPQDAVSCLQTFYDSMMLSIKTLDGLYFGKEARDA